MDFRLSEDQLTLMTAIEGLAAPYTAKPVDFHGFILVSDALDQELAENEFYDIAAFEDLGPVAAALTVEKLAQLPFTAEIALSMLVRPFLKDGDLPRPFAIVENGRPGRFVHGAKTVIVIEGDKLGIAHPGEGETSEENHTIYAYPMGHMDKSVAVEWLSDEEAETARKWIRVALSAEASGLCEAAIKTTTEYLTDRKQFGRPLGTFQALRHRMAECAVLAGGVRSLALQAAATGEADDAALAAFHAQDSGTRLGYELHQMLGAMGMTLEHPLHLWTYRLKALFGELGGRGGQAEAVTRLYFDTLEEA